MGSVVSLVWTSDDDSKRFIKMNSISSKHRVCHTLYVFSYLFPFRRISSRKKYNVSVIQNNSWQSPRTPKQPNISTLNLIPFQFSSKFCPMIDNPLCAQTINETREKTLIACLSKHIAIVLMEYREQIVRSIRVVEIIDEYIRADNEWCI